MGNNSNILKIVIFVSFVVLCILIALIVSRVGIFSHNSHKQSSYEGLSPVAKLEAQGFEDLGACPFGISPCLLGKVESWESGGQRFTFIGYNFTMPTVPVVAVIGGDTRVQTTKQDIGGKEIDIIMLDILDSNSALTASYWYVGSVTNEKIDTDQKIEIGETLGVASVNNNLLNGIYTAGLSLKNLEEQPFEVRIEDGRIFFK